MAQPQAARRPGVNVFDESKPMWRTMLVFLIPLMISNVLQSTSQTFSFVFLGRMLGVNALAAVSAVFPVVFLLFSFLIGIGSGSTVLIGQAFGAGDHHRVKKVAGTVLGATMLFSVITMLIGVLFSPAMLKALGTPPSIIAMSDIYTRVVFLTFPVYFPYIIYTTFLRGVGDSQTPLRFLVLGTVLSILFTPMLIRGWFGLPQFGVVSVALSGLLSTIIAFPLLLWHLRRTGNPLAFDSEMARDMVFDTRILWTVLRIGIPTGLQTIMVSLAEIAVISFVNRYGASATAAYGAVNQVIGYVQFPAISMSITASIFGAQCIGARREDKLGQVVRSAVALNYAVGGFLIAVCYIFSRHILGWFITDPATLEIAHGLLMITLWSYLLFGNSAVISGVVRSSGDVLVPTINGILSIWLVEVPAAYILMRYFGLSGVWMGYPISYAVVLSAQFSYYEFFWKKKTHERLA
jgi:MATE family, multidrug efflux pump